MTRSDIEPSTLPADFHASASVEEAAETLGKLLGLAGTAPVSAARKALDDPLFARALWAARKFPDLRDRLLHQPAEMRVTAPAPSNAAIVTKAVGSLLKWGMEGMKPASPWIIERRLAACNGCVFQAPAPETLIYRGARVAVREDARICTSCNCLTNTKAVISTEHCPERDPENPELSRWGEPWIDPKDHPPGPW